MSLAAGVSLLLIMILIECMYMKFVLGKKVPWTKIVSNLNSGHILLWIFRGVELIVYNFVLNNFSLSWIAVIPVWLSWIICFFFWDLCFYWLHRLHHRIPFLWAVHEVHHDSDHFDLSLGVRNSWFSSITSIPFFLLLAVLGFPLEMFIIVGSVHYFIQFYNHTAVVKKSGLLEYFMVTPSHHRVHHGTNKEYINKNCGGSLIIWDKIFGTFQQELEDIEISYGIRHPNLHNNPTVINLIPFAKLYKLKFNPETAGIKSGYLSTSLNVVGALLLFVKLIFFISVQQEWPANQIVVLFAVIFFGSVANGALLDRYLWGYYLWLLVVSVNMIFSVFVYPPSLSLQILNLTLVVHSILLIAYERKWIRWSEEV